MRDGLRSALAAVVRRLDDVPYRLGGSAMLSLRGLPIAPEDIDIQVNSQDREAVLAAVGDWLVSLDATDDGGQVTSEWLATLDVDSEKVEIMADLAVRSGASRWALPLRGADTAEVDGATVALADPGPWVVLYAVYRPATAGLLAPLVTAEDRDALLRELPAAMGIEWPFPEESHD